MLFNISEYLKKISKLSNEQEAFTIAVKEAFKKNLNLEIKEAEYVFKNGIITVNKNPSFKSEIMLKKNSLLKNINDYLGEKKVFDIK